MTDEELAYAESRLRWGMDSPFDSFRDDEGRVRQMLSLGLSAVDEVRQLRELCDQWMAAGREANGLLKAEELVSAGLQQACDALRAEVERLRAENEQLRANLRQENAEK